MVMAGLVLASPSHPRRAGSMTSPTSLHRQQRLMETELFVPPPASTRQTRGWTSPAMTIERLRRAGNRIVRPPGATDVQGARGAGGLLARRNPAAEPGTRCFLLSFGRLRPTFPMVAVTVQIVQFLPQILAARLNFGEKLAQVQDLRLQYRDFQRRFVSRVIRRFHCSAGAFGNCLTAPPAGSWRRLGRSRSSEWPTVHQMSAPSRTKVENRPFLEAR